MLFIEVIGDQNGTSRSEAATEDPDIAGATGERQLTTSGVLDTIPVWAIMEQSR